MRYSLQSPGLARRSGVASQRCMLQSKKLIAFLPGTKETDYSKVLHFKFRSIN